MGGGGVERSFLKVIFILNRGTDNEFVAKRLVIGSQDSAVEAGPTRRAADKEDSCERMFLEKCFYDLNHRTQDPN